MSEGNYIDAQKKFLEALNVLSEAELSPTLLLDRREAYAVQLLHAIQAERKAIKTKNDQTEQKPDDEPKK